MGKAELENGFARVATGLLEALATAEINATGWRLLMVIIRLTYGYQRKTHRISLGEFSKFTGIARNNVPRYIQALSEARIIIVQAATSPQQSPAYSINTKTSQWQGTKPLQNALGVISSDNTPPAISSDSTLSSVLIAPTAISSDNTLKDKGKDNLKDKTPIIPFEEILDCYLTSASPHWPMVKKLTSHIKDQIKARWKADKERQSIHWWRWYFDFAAQHPHLRGENDRQWRASLVWLIGVQNMDKVLSGYYNNDSEPVKGKQSKTSSAIADMLGKGKQSHAETLVDGDYQKTACHLAVVGTQERAR